MPLEKHSRKAGNNSGNSGKTKEKREAVMQELFMKYPVGSIVEWNGSDYQVLGYEMYGNKRVLICKNGEDGFRIGVDGRKITGHE